MKGVSILRFLEENTENNHSRKPHSPKIDSDNAGSELKVLTLCIKRFELPKFARGKRHPLLGHETPGRQPRKSSPGCTRASRRSSSQSRSSTETEPKVYILRA